MKRRHAAAAIGALGLTGLRGVRAAEGVAANEVVLGQSAVITGPLGGPIRALIVGCTDGIRCCQRGRRRARAQDQARDARRRAGATQGGCQLQEAARRATGAGAVWLRRVGHHRGSRQGAAGQRRGLGRWLCGSRLGAPEGGQRRLLRARQHRARSRGAAAPAHHHRHRQDRGGASRQPRRRRGAQPGGQGDGSAPHQAGGLWRRQGRRQQCRRCWGASWPKPSRRR